MVQSGYSPALARDKGWWRLSTNGVLWRLLYVKPIWRWKCCTTCDMAICIAVFFWKKSKNIFIHSFYRNFSQTQKLFFLIVFLTFCLPKVWCCILWLVMCVYVCVYISACVYVYVHICFYVCLCVYVYMYVYVYCAYVMCVRVMYSCMSYMYVCVYVYTSVFVFLSFY